MKRFNKKKQTHIVSMKLIFFYLSPFKVGYIFKYQQGMGFKMQHFPKFEYITKTVKTIMNIQMKHLLLD